ncbi:hypothetical protein [Arenibacter latericius]|uniref:hypothetical protein n=1 Tax=Arenibacter latericius TaxID=86104 RepID=UPI00146C85C8|nr:hypothetical protein [Arenibacter latericius]
MYSCTKTREKEYRARKHVCIECPIREQCLGRSAQEKKFSVTYCREEYTKNIALVNNPQDRYMKGKRQSTVEIVLGAEKYKHNRHRAGQQVHAALRHCIQLEEVLEILRKTCQKWGKDAGLFI